MRIDVFRIVKRVALCNLALIVGASAWAWRARQNMDLSRKPPPQTFARVFKMPVPRGSSLQVAGIAGLSGEVWMRVRVANANVFVNAMKHNRALEIIETTPDEPNLLPTRARICQDPDAATVGWTQALKIKAPRYYEFSTLPQGTGWAGVLVVDDAHRTIYVNGGLL